MEYKGYEIWKDNLGRWLSHDTKSSYGRENDYTIHSSKEAAKAYIRYKHWMEKVSR